MVTKYVWYSRQFNADTICVVQESLMLTQHVLYRRDLMLTQYVLYSKKINADTLCVLQQTN
jgi:hypothetical protein